MCSKAERAAVWSEDTANDNTHGYSNNIRWGPSYDCSSFLISAYEAAGVPVKANGASYTGDMKDAFLRSGFKDVTSQVNLQTGAGAIRGDVFLNEHGRGVTGSTGHAVICLGNGKVANCRSAEGTTDTADNSGNEIRIQNFWPYPWDCCLRLPEAEDVSNLDTQTGFAGDGICGPETWAALARRMPTVREGSASWAVTALQAMLNALGEDLDADSEFGPLTKTALIQFQSKELQEET